MNPTSKLIAAGLAVAVLATPIFAQQRGGQGGDRPSRECRQEVVKLCGRDGSKIRSCLQEKASQVSDKCQTELRQRMQQRREARGEQAPKRAYQRAVNPTRTVIYGNDPKQQIDVYAPKDAVDDLPLILYVHGGGWSMGDNKYVQSKPAHFTGKNMFFASTGYRLLPDFPVEDQARDVGLALQALVGQAGSIGFEKNSVILMGHSAGAHLAALVAADPQYAGDAFSAIKGVILLDGAGYDVATNIKSAKSAGRVRSANLYLDVFGDDPARQTALSPLNHVGGKDAPNWLALYVGERAVAKEQAVALVAKLTSNGSAAKATPIANTNHSRMNRELGTEPGKAQTQAVDAFLAQVLN